MRLAGVWGAGREGLAAARQLLGEGSNVIVVDESESPRPAELDVRARFLGGHGALEALIQCDIVFCSPGVARTHPFRSRLSASKIVTSTALWMRRVGPTTIGVTGTKGKSTTTTLISLLLRQGGASVQVGGNIGVPLSDLDSSSDLTIAEMSSYQCAYIDAAPRLAVITSLYEDHLPWHGDKRQYWLDKANILGPGCEALVCDEDTLQKLKGIAVNLPDRVIVAHSDMFGKLRRLNLSGPLQLTQNLRNFALAILAAEFWLGENITPAELRAAAQMYEPLPHRLEKIFSKQGVNWIDDTLSTVPESVVAALESVVGPTILILGGEDRGLNYEVLSDVLLKREPRPHLIAIPTNGSRIVREYRSANPTYTHDAADLKEAVSIAVHLARPGSTVLLSPGAPSYDHYLSFEQKSFDFARAIELQVGAQ